MDRNLIKTTLAKAEGILSILTLLADSLDFEDDFSRWFKTYKSSTENRSYDTQKRLIKIFEWTMILNIFNRFYFSKLKLSLKI